MENNFCFATFCFGDRYYEQVNRFINDITKSSFKPILIVLTDNIDKIKKEDFVVVTDISKYNSDYLNYKKNYFDFDFSVKRYSLQSAFELGYKNVVLVDADVRVNYQLFNIQNITNSFEKNSILGPVTYNFYEQMSTNSMLGLRLIQYENEFKKNINKDELLFMPEDCIQYISIDDGLFSLFLKTWDDCILFKKEKSLRNVPAGNIDEMCFSAISNGIRVGNNSNKSSNIVYAEHDKWYY